MLTENNKKIVRRMTEQSWNRGNVDVLDEVCLPTYRLQGVASVDQLKQEIAAYRCAFPDLHITIEELIAEGDAVVSRWSLSGTHLGPFEDIAPTGKPVAASGISIFHFVDGKIVEDYVESSSPGPRQQLLD
jgi:predicted ester cyclase